MTGLLKGKYETYGLMRYGRDCEETLVNTIGDMYVKGLVRTPGEVLPAPSYPVARTTQVIFDD